MSRPKGKQRFFDISNNQKTLYTLSQKSKIHNDFFVFDTETGKKIINPDGTITIEWELRARPDAFIFGVVYGYNFTKVIHSHEEMVNEFKDSRYRGKYIFAHNFGRYDGSVLFDNIFAMDNKAIFIGSRFISCTNGVVKYFGDSLNILKASVKEIGKAMKVKKTMGGIDNNYEKSHWPTDKARDINGCITDCQIVWDALFNFFEEAGDIKLTIGSLAMTYYRRFAQPHHITSNENVKHFWLSYYGGRTEAFKLGKTNAQVIDVNSMYPDGMKNCTFPNPQTLKYEIITNVKKFTNILHHYEGAASVTVRHPDMWLGLLPYRSGGKLIFPTGTFKGVWNFNELRFAISHGVNVIAVDWICYSEKMESPFIQFVDNLYHGKFMANQNGNDLDEWKYKYLMNNLYGKFGQRIDEETIYISDINDKYDLIVEHQKAKTFIKIIPFNAERLDCFLVVKSSKGKDPSYSIPSFSSYITSWGRIKLGEKLISMKKNKPVYCDTDSIFFEINDGVESSNFLGEWKIENKIITEINGLKNYKWMKPFKKIKVKKSYLLNYVKPEIKITRIKGVPSRAERTGNNKYEYSNLVGTKEGLRRKMEIGTKIKRTKIISNKYDKRELLKDGETKPLTI